MASNPEDVIAQELRRIAAWIRTPGHIWPEDAIDECARVLENRASDFARRAAQATPPASPKENVDLHAAIMNLRAERVGLQPSPMRAAYREGFRDARHAAAELVAASPVPVAPQEAQAEVLASLEAIVDDMEARWDMDDPSTNPGIRDNVKRAHAAIRAVRRSVSPAAEER